MEKTSDPGATRRGISKIPPDTQAAPTTAAIVPIHKIEALLAAAAAFAMSPADGGHGHLIPTIEMLSAEVRELRRVLYGPAMGP